MAMATADAQQAQTAVASNANARNFLIEQLVAQVAMILAGFTGWYSDRDVADLGHRIGGIVVPTLRVAASQQDAYLAQIASMSGRTYRPIGPVDVAALRRNTTFDKAYQRLGEQYRFQRSQGDGPDRALAVTQNRAAVMNEMDVALASRAQSQAFMTKRGITEYRRVIHPEMSRGGSCGMCIKASEHLQRAADPMPLHGRCRCTEVPVVGKFDIGHALNLSDLESARQQGLPVDGESFRVVDHAETGPILTRS